MRSGLAPCRMTSMVGLRSVTLFLLSVAVLTVPAVAEEHGRLRGTVSMKETGSPIHGASVMIVELDRIAVTDNDGSYSFSRLPPGLFHVVAHLDHLFTQEAKTVRVEAEEESSLEFLLGLTTNSVEITVTASESHETVLEAFQDVESFDAYDLNESSAVSLGEALDHRVGTGIAKRSFGPGSSRPIIRGFDGDRVLVMEDGIRTGSLGSQSGDHGEVLNVAQMERLEVVKGPSTLLYSGNALGGTVNAIHRHHEHHRHPHEGLRGFLSGSGGTANSLGSGNAGFEYGVGKFQFWGNGGALSTGDYAAPSYGTVFNSATELANGGGGVGWYGRKTFLALEAKAERGEYGVPFAQEFHAHGHEEEEEHHEGEGEAHEQEGEHEGEDDDDQEHHEEEEIERVALQSRRDSYRVTWGLRELGGPIESFLLKLSHVEWHHDEIEHLEDGTSQIGTTFLNDRFVYRGVFEQKRAGPLSGRFGFWGIDRDYAAEGEEALSPPVSSSGMALFGLEEVDFERFKLQFGGRIETRSYRPAFSEREDHEDEEDHPGDEGEPDGDDQHDSHGEPPDAVSRSFAGASLAAGFHAETWDGGVFVANFAHSYRAPSLEELYNFGPHAGNRAFEIGNPQMQAESGNGFDISARHSQERIRGEFNFFYYGFGNFIFPFATGEEMDELIEIEYTQRNVRFTGMEANLDVGLQRSLWLRLGMDFVDAKDTNSGTYLPRIPPLRGKIGLEFRRGGLKISPSLILASEQNRTFTGETSTPEYAVMDLQATYVYTQRHLVHQFSVNVFNVGDRLYRNHSSFIKDLAPEIGRGVRFTYMVRLF